MVSAAHRSLLPADADDKQVELCALQDEKIQRFLEQQTLKKCIVVPGKLVNLVVSA